MTTLSQPEDDYSLIYCYWSTDYQTNCIMLPFSTSQTLKKIASLGNDCLSINITSC